MRKIFEAICDQSGHSNQRLRQHFSPSIETEIQLYIQMPSLAVVRMRANRHCRVQVSELAEALMLTSAMVSVYQIVSTLCVSIDHLIE